jgi:hypothetical protein
LRIFTAADFHRFGTLSWNLLHGAESLKLFAAWKRNIKHSSQYSSIVSLALCCGDAALPGQAMLEDIMSAEFCITNVSPYLHRCMLCSLLYAPSFL